MRRAGLERRQGTGGERVKTFFGVVLVLTAALTSEVAALRYSGAVWESFCD